MRDRTYLYVPFEERAQARALGARWDFQRKCWYIGALEDPGPYRRWMDREDAASSGEHEYSIVSDQARIALTRARCWKCRTSAKVACIYCHSGWVDGDRYEDFTVSNITAIDDALRRQLARWPFFRFGYSKAAGGRYLANHCARCHALQADYYLHCEPGGAFFVVKGAPPGAITLERLDGRVRMDGDQGFEP